MVFTGFLMVFYWCKQRYIIIKTTLNHRCYLHPMTSTFTVFTWKSNAITIKLPSKQSPLNYHQMTPVFFGKNLITSPLNHFLKLLNIPSKSPFIHNCCWQIPMTSPWNHHFCLEFSGPHRSPQSPFPILPGSPRWTGDPGYPTNCPKLVHWSRWSKSLLNKLLRSTR